MSLCTFNNFRCEYNLNSREHPLISFKRVFRIAILLFNAKSRGLPWKKGQDWWKRQTYNIWVTAECVGLIYIGEIGRLGRTNVNRTTAGEWRNIWRRIEREQRCRKMKENRTSTNIKESKMRTNVQENRTDKKKHAGDQNITSTDTLQESESSQVSHMKNRT